MNQEQEQFTPEGAQDATSQAETPTQFAPAASAAAVDYTKGWSWGAFMFNAYFLIAIRKYTYLLFLLLVLVPLIGPLILLGVWIYLGMKGRELAVDSRTFDNNEQRIGYIKAIDHAGKVVFFVLLAFTALGLLLGTFIVGSELSGARERAEEAARMQEMQMDEIEEMRRDLDRMDY